MNLFESTEEIGSTNPTEILNTLLQRENIEQKTDLSIHQIQAIFKVHLWSKFKLNRLRPKKEQKEPEEILLESIEYLMVLLCSKSRLSRQETTKTLKELTEQLSKDQKINENPLK